MVRHVGPSTPAQHLECTTHECPCTAAPDHCQDVRHLLENGQPNCGGQVRGGASLSGGGVCASNLSGC